MLVFAVLASLTQYSCEDAGAVIDIQPHGLEHAGFRMVSAMRGLYISMCVRLLSKKAAEEEEIHADLARAGGLAYLKKKVQVSCCSFLPNGHIYIDMYCSIPYFELL